jgi:acyl-CoA reductase-like NAD-dependent aldehyde dehydrogenase
MNCVLALEACTPIVGYKQSGIGGDLGQYALDTFVIYHCDPGHTAEYNHSYTQVKSVHVNLGMKL